jgi:hypothetical protein
MTINQLQQLFFGKAPWSARYNIGKDGYQPQTETVVVMIENTNIVASRLLRFCM